MRPAERAVGGQLNALARARAELTDAGARVIDLSDSNPTRHGLLHPAVLDAVAKHAHDALLYEPRPSGPLAAREALAAHYGGDSDDYWLTSSTSEAYAWLLALVADPGQAVAVPVPGYPLLEPIARLAGVRTVGYHLHYVPPGDWILDPATLSGAVSNRNVRAVIAVNPGNPTGAYLASAGEDLVAACAAHGIALIVDEVFYPFILDGPDARARPTSLASEHRAVTFTLGGLSKLLCAPHLKLSWIRISGPATDLAALRNGLDTIADTFLPVNGPVAAALPELLTLSGEIVTATRQRLAENLAEARNMLADSLYRVRRCEGGWTVLIDVPQYLPAEDLTMYLLRRAGLAVHPGWFYDLPSEGTLALSLLPEPARFAHGLRLLRGAIDGLADRQV